MVTTDCDPLVDDDLQLALYLCYELHYRSFHGVANDLEWNPALLADRAELERAFLNRLCEEYDAPTGPIVDVPDALVDLIAQDRGPSLSNYMLMDGTQSQFREFAIHRSAYQRKEADPHTWAIPRLAGDAKAALVRLQADEYGNGVTRSMHAELFAATMAALGLDPTYGAYLADLPGSTLATVNLISLFGLHRAWRGALVGNLTVFEMSSVIPMSRYAASSSRLGFPPVAREFYDVHVVADEHHQQVALRDMAGALARDEPDLARDIVFGAGATLGTEARFAAHLLEAWSREESSLNRSHTIVHAA